MALLLYQNAPNLHMIFLSGNEYQGCSYEMVYSQRTCKDPKYTS